MRSLGALVDFSAQTREAYGFNSNAINSKTNRELGVAKGAMRMWQHAPCATELKTAGTSVRRRSPH